MDSSSPKPTSSRSKSLFQLCEIHLPKLKLQLDRSCKFSPQDRGVFKSNPPHLSLFQYLALSMQMKNTRPLVNGKKRMNCYYPILPKLHSQSIHQS